MAGNETTQGPGQVDEEHHGWAPDAPGGGPAEARTTNNRGKPESL
jgi:hypothetical protein